MSAEGSEADNTFVEHDTEGTRMAYDNGGVPLFIGALWVVFLIIFVAFMLYYTLPDLNAWFGS